MFGKFVLHMSSKYFVAAGKYIASSQLGTYIIYYNLYYKTAVLE